MSKFPLFSAFRSPDKCRDEAAGRPMPVASRRRIASRLGVESLESRLLLHGQGDPEHDLGDHVHMNLTIFVSGQYVPIPDGIGLDATNHLVAVPHTEGAGGIIHQHAATGLTIDHYTTLGEFFDAWRTDTGAPGPTPNAIFNRNNLMGNAVDATHEVRMFVNGQPNDEYENYAWHNGDSVVLDYTLKTAPASLTLVHFDTVMGGFDAELYPAVAPLNVANFLHYANGGDYNDTVIHRSLAGFVIQGGGYDLDAAHIPTDPPVQNEFHITNTVNTLAMAKLGGDPNSATSEWFVSLGDNSANLDNQNGGFTVFGRVLTNGNDAAQPHPVVQAIANLQTVDGDGDSGGTFDDLPVRNFDGVSIELENLVIVNSIAVVPSQIHGVVFADTDADGVRDAGETGQAGWNVYVDANNNGTRESTETLVTTGADGSYAFTNLAAGTQVVRVQSRNGFIVSAPATARRDVTLYIGQDADDQDFGVRQVTSAPTVVDLVNTFDSGTSSIDNLTKQTSLQFQVFGVTVGATVKLFVDGALAGQTVTTSDIAQVTTTTASQWTNGPHSVTATQTVGGLESVASSALALTIDTTLPGAFTSTPPTQAIVGVALSYNAQSPEEGTTGSVYSLASGAPGGVSINATTGVVSWTPAAAQAGPQSFTIKLTDAAGNERTQAVSLTVLGQLPAQPDTYNVTEDVILTVPQATGVLANDGDLGAGSLSATRVTGPAHGTLNLGDNGSFSYQPNGDYFGPDSFTYQATDGTRTSAATTVSLSVQAVQDLPVGVADSYSATEDQTLTVAAAQGVLANDHDPDNDPLTAQLASNVSHGTLALAGGGSFTYTPAANYHGPDQFTYRVGDGTATSQPVTVSINVASVNDPPVGVPDSYVVDEDGVLDVAAAQGVLANDHDDDGDAVTATLMSGPAHGTLTLSANGSFVYHPTANYFGPDSFIYRASDGASAQGQTTASITVNSENDTPDAVADQYAVSSGVALVIGAATGVLHNDTDPDNATLSADLVSGPAHGTLTLAADGSFSYTSTAGFSGADSFTYRASDGAASDIATVTIEVNNAPHANANDYQAIEDQILTIPATTGVLADDLDDEGDALSAELVAGPAHGTLTLNPDGSFAYTPSTNYNGDDSFTYRARDQFQPSTPATVTIHLSAVNDAPSAVADGYRVDRDGSLNVAAAQGVLVNDSDVDADPLTAELVSGASHGALTLHANGSIEYTPTTGFTGADSFTYRASDGVTPSSPVTVTLSVNSPPTAVVDSYAAVEDEPLNVGAASGVLANDTDAENDPRTAQIAQNPAHGTATLNADGSFTYTPAADFNGADTFTYRASDGHLASAETTVTINVAARNDAPVAAADAYFVDEDTALSVSASAVDRLLANDTDIDSLTLSTALVSPPAHGSVTLDPSGAFSYTPAANFNGTDSFTYRASDGAAVSNTATVTITVRPVNDPPAFAAASNVVGVSGTPIRVPLTGHDVDSSTVVLAYSLDSAPVGATINPLTGQFQWTPPVDAGGSFLVTARVSEPGAAGLSSTVSFAVNVVPVGALVDTTRPRTAATALTATPVTRAIPATALAAATATQTTLASGKGATLLATRSLLDRIQGTGDIRLRTAEKKDKSDKGDADKSEGANTGKSSGASGAPSSGRKATGSGTKATGAGAKIRRTEGGATSGDAADADPRIDDGNVRKTSIQRPSAADGASDAVIGQLDFTTGDVAALQLTRWTLPAWAALPPAQYAMMYGKFLGDHDVLDEGQLLALARMAVQAALDAQSAEQAAAADTSSPPDETVRDRAILDGSILDEAAALRQVLQAAAAASTLFMPLLVTHIERTGVGAAQSAKLRRWLERLVR